MHWQIIIIIIIVIIIIGGSKSTECVFTTQKGKVEESQYKYFIL